MHVGWKKEIDALRANYWHTFFKSIGEGFLGIFVPVFVFVKGQEVRGDWIMGVRWVLGYLILQRVVTIGLVFVAARFAERKGFRWSVLLGVFFTIATYLVLILADINWRWLFLAAIMAGASIPFYWIPRLSMNAEDGHKESIGSEIGIRTLITKGVAVMGPFAGGVVISLWGFEVLFGLGVAVMLVSTLPLFFMSKHKHRDGANWKGLVNFVGKSENRPYIKSFFGNGMSVMAVGWVWPLFVFVVVGGFQELGAVTSAVMAVSMIGVWVMSRLFDWLRSRGGDEDEKVFVGANIVVAVMMVVKSFAQSIWGIFWLDSIHQIALPGAWTPIYGYLYTAAGRMGAVRFFAYRELIFSVGVILAAVVSLWLISIPWGWQWVFGLGSLGVLLNIPMKTESNR